MQKEDPHESSYGQYVEWTFNGRGLKPPKAISNRVADRSIGGIGADLTDMTIHIDDKLRRPLVDAGDL